MFLATASTKRPIAMSCLLIALIGLGLNSYRKLSIEDMPKVDIPYVTVVTTWVGASPEDIEKDVSKHIEDAVSGIDGLRHIESSSLENVNQVVLEFNVGVDVDVAAQEVREKVDAVLDDLHPTLAVVDAHLPDLNRALAVLGPAFYGQAQATTHGPWLDIYVAALGPDIFGLLEDLTGVLR